ncbi:helix-turn-helix domain-containing protein [Pseudobacillus sp. 179-B 2D1 NHS]|uniref:helix-turn-helix domain-containing protein n=1 Tax=Pseudobacillus sp. 179-B 2D1 NHS TaxID=3374292 RepID=UPI0038797754
MNNLNTFGERLKNIRKAKDLTQKELADAVDIDQSSISYFERNKKKPDMDTLKKIADILNVSADYLLLRTNSPVDYSPEQSHLIKKLNANPFITPEELKENYRFVIEGREATTEEIEEAIRYVRIQRMMKEKDK